jgi:hypothetical protein
VGGHDDFFMFLFVCGRGILFYLTLWAVEKFFLKNLFSSLDSSWKQVNLINNVNERLAYKTEGFCLMKIIIKSNVVLPCQPVGFGNRTKSLTSSGGRSLDRLLRPSQQNLASRAEST